MGCACCLALWLWSTVAPLPTYLLNLSQFTCIHATLLNLFARAVTHQLLLSLSMHGTSAFVDISHLHRPARTSTFGCLDCCEVLLLVLASSNVARFLETFLDCMEWGLGVS